MTASITANITQFRKELFTFADQALQGQSVGFVHRGVQFRVVPETKQSKLANLSGQQVVAKDLDLESAGHELLAEMEAEWRKDWSEL